MGCADAIMDFRIADTFTDSLGLTGEEQKSRQDDGVRPPDEPGGAGDAVPQARQGQGQELLVVRVSRDVRLIVHRAEGSLLLCYVGHHDDAYQWAERRKLETHPKTGAAQLVEIRERVGAVADEADLQDVFNTERHPLYVACTRARDHLLVTGVEPASEFLDDLRTSR